MNAPSTAFPTTAPPPSGPPPSGNLLPDGFLIDARNRMVDSQIRPNRVSDPRILDVMRRLPRERFLPEALLAQSYADQNVHLGSGRVLMQPLVLARLVQAAAPLSGEKVLVVAAGAGYSAALLAAFGCDVTALEEPGMLLDQARAALAALAPSVRLVSGSAPAGWPAGAPYDIILIDGAVPEVPATLASQLNRQTGRLMTIVGPNTNPGGMPRTGLAVQAEPTPAGVSQRALFDVLCPILPCFAAAPAFEF
jgi:protein-L-isoaspartate(D-aspartate) O-methyltransferase